VAAVFWATAAEAASSAMTGTSLFTLNS